MEMKRASKFSIVFMVGSGKTAQAVRLQTARRQGGSKLKPGEREALRDKIVDGLKAAGVTLAAEETKARTTKAPKKPTKTKATAKPKPAAA
jgi:hypothetical protein